MPTVKFKGPAKLTADDIKRLKEVCAKPDSAIDFSDIPEVGEAWFKKAKRMHGGARPGAGRKPTGNVRMWVSVPPSVKARIEARAKREGKTVADLLTEKFGKTA